MKGFAVNFRPVLITAILAIVAAAQSRDEETEVRTFHLTSLPGGVAYQEIVTTFHKVVQVSQELPVDPVSGELTVSGTRNQLVKAAWIVENLDSGALESPGRTYHRDAICEKPFTGPDGEVLEIFRLASDAKPQTLAEMITTLRQVGDITHLSQYSPTNSIIIGTTADRAKLAEWLVMNVQNSASDTEAGQEFHITGLAENTGDADENLVRVLHWNSALSSKEVQQLVTTIRQAEIWKLYTNYATRALAVRGDAAELSLAADLIATFQPSR